MNIEKNHTVVKKKEKKLLVQVQKILCCLTPLCEMPGIGKSVQRLHWWFPGARGEMGVTATEHRVSL